MVDSRLPKWLSGKESACQYRRPLSREVLSLSQENPWEKEVVTHSNILA